MACRRSGSGCTSQEFWGFTGLELLRRSASEGHKAGEDIEGQDILDVLRWR